MSFPRNASVVATALIGLVMVLAGCGSSDDESETTASRAKSTPTTAASTPEEATVLEGTWRTGPITVADMADSLREAGLGESVGNFEQNAPVSDAPTSLILKIADDWDLYGQAQGERRKQIDYDARFEVEGKKVVVIHSEGSNTFRWSVRNDVLQLTWLETTLGSYKGIPEEAFQRALYMTAEFHRAS
jgi:hypothetical protein